jgi:hypothetical protein
MREILWKTILPLGLTVILVGCNPVLVKRPTKPTLQVQTQNDGGICLSKDDTKLLGIYILELEKL